ncbi:hypothetical protein NUU61_000578 [Penicillium alfredii]|uniref:Uncharacterized protein n=1 Tax=Penicillium alfredii TaxID=1506179 RepID=A0A9W9G9V8_9EURO|nr:uncharacterized protein NUU61_000578 [Penicillium alfredii]KAJ5114819.1 hypothetical protein NUU61_000578 [Penicillium alfredii]
MNLLLSLVVVFLSIELYEASPIKVAPVNRKRDDDPIPHAGANRIVNAFNAYTRWNDEMNLRSQFRDLPRIPGDFYRYDMRAQQAGHPSSEQTRSPNLGSFGLSDGFKVSLLDNAQEDIVVIAFTPQNHWASTIAHQTVVDYLKAPKKKRPDLQQAISSMISAKNEPSRLPGFHAWLENLRSLEQRSSRVEWPNDIQMIIWQPRFPNDETLSSRLVEIVEEIKKQFTGAANELFENKKLRWKAVDFMLKLESWPSADRSQFDCNHPDDSEDDGDQPAIFDNDGKGKKPEMEEFLPSDDDALPVNIHGRRRPPHRVTLVHFKNPDMYSVSVVAVYVTGVASSRFPMVNMFKDMALTKWAGDYVFRT